MKDNRRHKRFTLDVMEVNGAMISATDVKIIDISLGGVSIKADRRLNIGTEYPLKLGDKNKVMSLKGTVIWSSLVGTRKTGSGERIPIYQAGMKFTGLTEKETPELMNIIERNKMDGPLPSKGRRTNVRFQIKARGKAVLHFPENFRVRQISLGGMLIDSDCGMETGSKMPMELFPPGGGSICFDGRVVFCRALSRDNPNIYAAGIEFLNLNEGHQEVLADFIAYCEAREIERGDSSREGEGI
jgi:c-di-GMP-binding flagellar brake protein YcgR